MARMAAAADGTRTGGGRRLQGRAVSSDAT